MPQKPQRRTMDQAVEQKDSNLLLSLVENQSVSETDQFFEALIQVIRFRGSFIEPLRRDKVGTDTLKFEQDVLMLFESKANVAAREQLGALREVTTAINECYRTILDSLDRIPLSQSPVDSQIWTLLDWTETARASITRTATERVQNQAMLLEPSQLHVSTADGIAINVDTFISNVFETLGDTLKMLAHRHGLFHGQNKKIIIPARPKDFKAQSHQDAAEIVVLGKIWDHVAEADTSIRLYGGAVKRQRSVVGGESFETLVFDLPAKTLQLPLIISSDRITRISLQHGLEATSLPKSFFTPRPLGNVRGEQYISEVELSLTTVLEQLFHLELRSAEKLYGDLKMREWIRAFASIHEFAERWSTTQSANEAAVVHPDVLIVHLTKDGLTIPKAKWLVGLLTLKQKSTDLFDAPFIQDSSGRLVCWPHLLTTSNFSKIIISILSALNVEFGEKGKGLEQRVLNFFKSQNMVAKGFKYHENGETYEYDAVLLWENTLFVFECKNRSVAPNDVLRGFHFHNELREHVAQTKRLKNALIAHPQWIQEQFGTTPGLEIHACILNGLPYCQHPIDGVYVYDYSSLVRFFQSNGNLEITNYGPKKDFSLPLKRIWQTQRPSPSDLISQLSKPVQFELLSLGHRLIEPEMKLSTHFSVKMPIVATNPNATTDSLNSLRR